MPCASIHALENPDAEKRWLKGEDVFAGVARDALFGGDDGHNKRRLIELLVAGAEGKEFPPGN